MALAGVPTILIVTETRYHPLVSKRTKRHLSLRRALFGAFLLVALLTGLSLMVIHRIYEEDSLVEIREAEITRAQGIAEGVRDVAEHALESGASYRDIERIIGTGMRSAAYIRIEHLSGEIVAETGHVSIPPRPTTISGVTAIPKLGRPDLYEITMALGGGNVPKGVLRIGLAEASMRQQVQGTLVPFQRSALYLSVFFVIVACGTFLFIAWVYGRLQNEEDGLRENERQAYLGAVAAGVVHDVRHPLGSIRLGIDLAREELRRGQEDLALERLNLLDHEFQRAQFALDIFRDYAQQGEFRPISTDLRPLVDDVAHLMRGSLVAQKTHIEIAGEKSEIRALVDPARLKQAVLNLLVNAAESMQEGGTLRIELAAAGLEVELRIVDTGHGIPADLVPQIFQPYTSTKEHGRGIGLSIVKQAIEDHGGRISVTSGPTGTTFLIVLPAAS